MNDSGRWIAAFGPFRLSPTTRELERNGVPIAVGDRALDILIALIEHPGKIVSQKELMTHAWRGLVVSPGNVRVHMTALRKALGEGTGGAHYIENVVGQGYCFVAPVIHEGRMALPTQSAQFPDAARKQLVLPPRLARMIGREQTVQSTIDELLSERFVTLIGPGGVGKTTVAIAVAHAMRREFPDAVCFVDVGDVCDPKLVVATVATSLGLAPQATNVLPTLLEYLRTRRLLLVLDNCEHVIDTMASLTETIFRETSEVHILATSREALRVEGEHACWLPALECPAPRSSMKAVDVRKFPAVALFMERAAASGARFELDDGNAAIVADICGRLEGIALAIELAAGRVGSHGIAATAELLNKNLGLDWHGRRTALPRHQTLRALIDWSYGLLSEPEQQALRRLSVLIGPFTIEAAAAIVQDDETDRHEAACTLDALVAKSLLSAIAADDGSVRYRLPETTRMYAREKLQKSGEAAPASQRHAKHFMALLNSRHGGQIDLEYTGRAHMLREHLGNVRAALEWCFARDRQDFDPVVAVNLAAAAVPVFFELSLLGESYDWSAAALAVLDDNTRGDRREMLLRSTWAISSMWIRGNSDDVLPAISRGLELAQPLHEPVQRLRMLATRHVFLARTGDCRGALAAARQWDNAAREIGDVTCLAVSDLMLGVAQHFRGDQALAMRHFAAGFARAETRSLQLCGTDHRVRAMITLARAQWLRGMPDQAVRTALEGITTAMQCGKPLDTCFALLYTAPVYLWCGHWSAAQEILTQLSGHSHWPLLKPLHAVARAMRGALLIGCGETQRGTAILLETFRTMHEQRQDVVKTFVVCWMADGLRRTRRWDEALTAIRRARREAARGGEAVHLPELLRIQAETLLDMSPAHEARAVRLLARARRIAHRQSALAWELRSTATLARIRIQQNRREEATRLLLNVYEQFTEGFDTSDLRSARTALYEAGRMDTINDMEDDDASSGTPSGTLPFLETAGADSVARSVEQ